MPKPIRFSHHAETVARERGLDRDWIVQTIEEPEWSEPDPSDPEVERRFRTIPQRNGRIIRVACVETPREIIIVSAFLDRGARRPK